MSTLEKEELFSLYDELNDEQKVRISKIVKKESTKAIQKKDRVADHLAKGKILFEFKDWDGRDKPLHHMDVELWDRDIGNPDDFLGAATTDLEGNFVIHYDPLDAGKNDLPDLSLRIYERKYTYRKDGTLRFSKRLVYTFRGEDNVVSKEYDFGEIRVPFWEYHPEKATPRALITDEGDPPQSYSPGRSVAMVKALASIEVKKRMHFLAAKGKNPKITLDKIQSDYPENRIRKLEKENPGCTRTDEFFGDTILNGMAASIMDKDPNDKTMYWIHYHWNSYEQDGIYAMPNVDIKLKMNEDKLVPVQISIWMREEGVTQPNAPLQEHRVTKEDGNKWEQAKRVARVSSALSAELDAHLCQTHLNTEQYALAAYRNIRKNPVRNLLFPHIKEVALINNSADSLLLGEDGYITKATGFTAESMSIRLKQVLGTLDWKNWTPRKKISEQHAYAEAASLYWNFLKEYVEEFFLNNHKEIEKEWAEIKLFSDELVGRSVPAFLCGYLDGTLNEENSGDWFDWNERMDLSEKRPYIAEVPKAVSRITESIEANQQDIDNLKQMCAYVIFHSTFAHWWSNSKQYDEGGDLRFTGLGLRYGENGIFVDESDDSILPPPKEATMQLWISYMLSFTKFGFIIKNEDKDISPSMIKRLLKLKPSFDAMGLDIYSIPSRTNI